MPAWLIPAIAGAASLAGNLIGPKVQGNANLQVAKYQHKKNMELLKYQQDYDSPASQMARYKAAGLNPNLIYSQGTSGNMNSAPQFPDIQPANYQQAAQNIGNIPTQVLQQSNQLELMKSQTNLTDAKAQESSVKQDLMRSQQQLIAANPYLNKDYVSAMVSTLEATAQIKLQEVAFNPISKDLQNRKTLQDIENLEQKFRLGESDQKIKAQIIESKDFQNALQKIQLDWLKNGDVTPQHIYQGILLLLSKMM